jgi:N-acetylgalactosamine PTS system EIIA component
MNGLIVTGHGNFATGLRSSVRLIAGNPERVEYVDFLEEDSTEVLEGKLKEALARLKECKEVLFLCDLVGGTPYNTAVMISASASDQNCAVVGGTNLSMLLEIAMIKDTIPLSELKEMAVQTGKNAIQFFEFQSTTEEVEEEGI